MSGFEIVQTEPEGEGKQPYFLRLVATNGEKIVKSENYAHRSGAESALIVIAQTLVLQENLSLKWNSGRTKAYLMNEGWMFSHAPIHFVQEYDEEPKPKPAAKKTAAKKTAAKKTPAKRSTRKTAATD